MSDETTTPVAGPGRDDGKPAPHGPLPKDGLGEPGEHPLSVLLFSWMRSAVFYRLFTGVVAAVCVVLAVMGVMQGAHGLKGIEAAPVFHGVFGFLAFGLAVLSGWALGPLLRRPEDYYERRRGRTSGEGEDDA
jgi:hypothetical protein